MNDYEVLGLKEGADEKEIKRAYFRLVRRFSPEKDPERFQQIRQAYEHLKEGGGRIQLKLSIPNDPFAKRMLQQIVDAYDRHDFGYAIDTAEEAIRYYGEHDGFLYYLARAQLENGNSGKAVRNFEKLAKNSPDNVIFAKMLALAYLERGYGKKAYEAFAKAYGMGCREMEFLNDYAMNCRDRGDAARAAALLTELIEIGVSDRKKNMMYLLDAYAGLSVLLDLPGTGDRDSIWLSFCRFLDESAPYMPEYEESVRETLNAVVFERKREGVFQAEDGSRILAALKKGLGSVRAEKLWKSVENDMEYGLLLEDDRLSDPWKVWSELLFSQDGEDEIDRTAMRYAVLDCKLCILEEWPRIKAEAEIIKDTYPSFYGAVREFVETLERGNLDYQRSKMRKEYDRFDRYMQIGMYGEKYGNRRHDRQEPPELLWEPDEDIFIKPYVRDTPKIGRNDPCPCGSGKKYKKCCGR